MDKTKINTDISSYTLDELFDLLNINVTPDMEYTEMIDEINKNIDGYIDKFNKLKNVELVNFFEDVRISLIGKDKDENLTSAESILLSYEDTFNAESNRGFKTNTTDTTDSKLYQSNSGAGNPINRKTISKLLTIDSKFRTNYNETSSTDYLIDLPYPIKNVIELKLSDLELPTTYYPISDDNENNYFWIKYNSSILGERFFYIYIPEGNYYHENFISYINSIFTDNSLPFTLAFDLTYSNLGGVGTGTGNITLGVDVDSSLNVFQINDLEINFSAPKLTEIYYSQEITDTNTINEYYNSTTIPLEQRIGWMLGFRNLYYSGGSSYKSESVLDIIGARYLFLVLEDFNKSTNSNFFTNSKYGLLPDNIIARISLKGGAFSIQAQNDFSIYSEPRFYYGPVNIEKLHVKVIDEFGRNLNLNKNDFSFSLSITTIYSKT